MRRACGALDTTLHEVFRIDWILELLVRPEVPQKPAKVPPKKKEIKIVDDNNDNEVFFSFFFLNYKLLFNLIFVLTLTLFVGEFK